MVTSTRPISTQQKTQITAGLYSGRVSTYLKIQRNLENFSSLLAPVTVRLMRWPNKPFPSLTTERLAKVVFEEEFQGKQGSVMHKDVVRRVKNRMETKDTWETGQFLPLQRKPSLLSFEHLISNWQNWSVFALCIFHSTKGNPYINNIIVFKNIHCLQSYKMFNSWKACMGLHI